ncbi:MAG: peptidoglycan DD-metalloendopeptidase family protein [Holophagaceae bacterium]|nr:peptidoglycan DD-metalloendopeptidase family protein [Holophagaceae bacterium]
MFLRFGAKQIFRQFYWLAFFSTLLSQTQEPPNQDIGKTRQRLQELQIQRSQVDNQINLLQKRRSGVLVELQGITLRASKARMQAEVAQLRREELQSELLLLKERKTAIQNETVRLKGSLQRQLKWLQALGPLGTLSFFPSYSDVENYLVRSRYQEWWRNRENQKLQTAQKLHAELIEQEREIAGTETKLSEVSIEMANLQEMLNANEKQLQEYLNRILRDEQQKKGIQSELNEESILLERMLESLLSKTKSGTNINPAIPFQNLMGKLPFPVEGSLAEGFGVQVHPRFGTRTMNSWLLIAAKGGATVKAVADGQVIKAESFQSFGLMAIISHGNVYHSLYMHLRALSVQEGQIIKSGETIGYVGDTPDGPRLGFGIIRNFQNKRTPEDPQKWLASRYVSRGR